MQNWQIDFSLFLSILIIQFDLLIHMKMNFEKIVNKDFLSLSNFEFYFLHI